MRLAGSKRKAYPTITFTPALSAASRSPTTSALLTLTGFSTNTARVRRCDCHLGEPVVRQGDDDPVQLLLGQHLAVILVVAGEAELPRGPQGCALIQVGAGHEVCVADARQGPRQFQSTVSPTTDLPDTNTFRHRISPLCSCG